MVEAAAAIVLRMVGRAVAPPGEVACRGGHEGAADIDPVMRLLKPESAAGNSVLPVRSNAVAAVPVVVIL